MGARHAAAAGGSGPAGGAADVGRGPPRAGSAPLAGAQGDGGRVGTRGPQEGTVKAGAPPQPAPPLCTHPSRTLGPLRAFSSGAATGHNDDLSNSFGRLS